MLDARKYKSGLHGMGASLFFAYARQHFFGSEILWPAFHITSQEQPKQFSFARTIMITLFNSGEKRSTFSDAMTVLAV